MAFHTDTALLLIDPYNDFIHPDGKIYDFLKESIETTNTVENIKRLIATARANKIPIYYCLHQNHKKGNYDGWNRMTFFTNLIQERRVVEEGSWGAQIYDGMEPDVMNGDVVIAKHWNASSFQTSDLHFLLGQRNITKVVCAGMTANQCLECTARYAVELGYNTTLLTDDTAGFSNEQVNAATKIIWSILVNHVLTVDEWAASLKEQKV